ncbi:SUN domain-containing protein 2 [Pseudoliparis swirei]|uniref:SUN domain-containing protein 2 n=1 Tax=Pseudoliparis swirei TaxID=2059687 RepID=UPI0024BEBE73|nr:SUN domain-containing protein 2 [Pseudoliparis swirei]
MGPLAPTTSPPRTPLFLRPGRKELSQSALDSSVYSSSDGPRRKTPTTKTTKTTRTTGTTGTTGTSGAPSAAYWDRIRCAFYTLMQGYSTSVASSASQTAAALKAQFTLLTAPGVPRVKKTCAVLFLLFIALLCVWLLPFLTSFVSLVADREPVLPPLPPPLPHVVVEEQLKQQLAQDSRVRLAAVDSMQVSGLWGQVEDLVLRVQDLEAQNAKLSQEWSSVQMRASRDPLSPELQQAMEAWLKQDSACRRPLADKMADFALESQGASVVSTRCSETYALRSACLVLFGLPLWFRSESPRTVIQGYPDMLPGRCWAFHGVQGTLLISLSHPITLTHVTLDHLPLYNSPTGSIDSAPKDFEVYGMKDEEDEGTLLGSFTYDEAGEPTQTFRLPNPSGEVHRCVELRVLSNWGHVQYTCLYRFRVHGEIAATP